jgi:hypothetical protein
MIRFVLALILLFVCTVAHGENVKKLSTSWTSDGSGASTTTLSFAGRILRVVTDPGATAPTDDYDVTLVDEYGLDLLMGRGVNRDTTNSEHFCPGFTTTDGTNTTVIPVTHYGTATLTIANPGSAKVGVVVIYYAVSDF